MTAFDKNKDNIMVKDGPIASFNKSKKTLMNTFTRSMATKFPSTFLLFLVMRNTFYTMETKVCVQLTTQANSFIRPHQRLSGITINFHLTLFVCLTFGTGGYFN